MERQHLQPPNSTPFERTLLEALDRTPELAPPIEAARSLRFRRPINASYAPWLVEQYGLGPIAIYFDTAEAAIDAGIPWQRLRGTPLAVETALDWIGYDSIGIEDQQPRRRKWNRYQIAMGLVPEAELPLLMDAEFLADLSDPARSVFFRGWQGYDVRALEWSGSRWSEALWGDDSGVRLDGGAVKWSHGESLGGAIVADGGDREALGIDYAADYKRGWGAFPWGAPGITWTGIVDLPAFKSFMLRRLPLLVGFYDDAGEPIGYRRPIAVRDVTAEHEPGEDAIVIEAECRTGFGDGEGRHAASCSLVFRAANPERPGALWSEPHEIVVEDGFDPADLAIGAVPLDFTFRRTVRQHVVLTLEI